MNSVDTVPSTGIRALQKFTHYSLQLKEAGAVPVSF